MNSVYCVNQQFQRMVLLCNTNLLTVSAHALASLYATSALIRPMTMAVFCQSSHDINVLVLGNCGRGSSYAKLV